MFQGRGRHTSLEKELKPEVEWLEGLSAVSRVILGRMENCRHSYTPGTLRVKREENHGVKMSGYTGRGVMDLFVVLAKETRFEEFKALVNSRYPTDR